MNKSIVFSLLVLFSYPSNSLTAVNHLKEALKSSSDTILSENKAWELRNFIYEFSLSSTINGIRSTLQIELIKAVTLNDFSKAEIILIELKKYNTRPADFYISRQQAELLKGTVCGICPSMTPLCFAKSSEMVKLLLTYGATANACTENGEFPAQKITSFALSADNYTNLQFLHGAFQTVKQQEKWLNKTGYWFILSKKNPLPAIAVGLAQGLIAVTGLGIMDQAVAADRKTEGLLLAGTVLTVGTVALWSYLIRNSIHSDANEKIDQENLFKMRADELTLENESVVTA